MLLVSGTTRTVGRLAARNPDRLHRVKKLLEFGAKPYPMPYVRTPELVGFQRWVIGSYARRGISWEAFKGARYRPEKLTQNS